jgi:putative oxidoreductase
MAEVKLLVEERRAAIDVLTTWLPRIALVMVFLFAGAVKFATHSVYVRIFATIGLGQWLRYFTGVIEIGGAVLLLIPRTAAVGFFVLACTMAGAVIFWLVNYNPFAALVPGVLLLAIIGFGGGEVARFVTGMRRGAAYH